MKNKTNFFLLILDTPLFDIEVYQFAESPSTFLLYGIIARDGELIK